MRAYLALFNAQLRVLLQYRAAAWAGVGTQIFFGAALAAIRLAFYAHNPTASPLDRSALLSYTWLAQAFFAMSPFTATPDPAIRQKIRDGSVAYELARPLDLYTLWYVRCAANRLAPALLRSGPILVLGYFFLGLAPPASLAAFCAFLAAMVGALALIASWMALISVTLLWTISGDGIARFGPSVVSTLSGQIVPLVLFPAWAQPIVWFLPFRGMVDAPFNLWIGHLPPGAIVGVLAHQLAWTVALVLLGRVLLQRGVRHLVVQGG